MSVSTPPASEAILRELSAALVKQVQDFEEEVEGRLAKLEAFVAHWKDEHEREHELPPEVIERFNRLCADSKRLTRI